MNIVDDWCLWFVIVQDHLRAMQMELGAKDTTIARLHEQLQVSATAGGLL